jgi:hypothetical protein
MRADEDKNEKTKGINDSNSLMEVRCLDQLLSKEEHQRQEDGFVQWPTRELFVHTTGVIVNNQRVLWVFFEQYLTPQIGKSTSF